jgi:hypothetical protein
MLLIPIFHLFSLYKAAGGSPYFRAFTVYVKNNAMFNYKISAGLRLSSNCPEEAGPPLYSDSDGQHRQPVSYQVRLRDHLDDLSDHGTIHRFYF